MARQHRGSEEKRHRGLGAERLAVICHRGDSYLAPCGAPLGRHPTQACGFERRLTVWWPRRRNHLPRKAPRAGPGRGWGIDERRDAVCGLLIVDAPAAVVHPGLVEIALRFPPGILQHFDTLVKVLARQLNEIVR